MTARANIRIGPTTQFWTSDKPSTRVSRKTSRSSSYRTLVKGGYIITMSPTAIGIEVVPILKRFRNGTIPGSRHPKATPMTMAAKIHAVRKRSRKLRRRVHFGVVMVIVIAASLLSDTIYFFFQREAIQCRQRKRKKKTDAPVKNKKRFAKGAVDFGGVSVNRGWVGHSPVRCHGLSRPQRARFLGGVVANREDEMQIGSAGAPERVRKEGRS